MYVVCYTYKLLYEHAYYRIYYELIFVCNELAVSLMLFNINKLKSLTIMS